MHSLLGLAPLIYIMSSKFIHALHVGENHPLQARGILNAPSHVHVLLTRLQPMAGGSGFFNTGLFASQPSLLTSGWFHIRLGATRDWSL